MEACFSQKSLLTKFLFSPIIKPFVFSYKLLNLFNRSLKRARSENQSVSEFSGDTDSESKWFQFDRGILTKVSQSTLELKTGELLTGKVLTV